MNPWDDWPGFSDSDGEFTFLIDRCGKFGHQESDHTFAYDFRGMVGILCDYCGILMRAVALDDFEHADVLLDAVAHVHKP